MDITHFNWTYVGDVVHVAGFREQLDALCVVSLNGEMQSAESSARAWRHWRAKFQQLSCRCHVTTAGRAVQRWQAVLHQPIIALLVVAILHIIA